MDFAIEKRTTGGTDNRWLASSHGTDTAQPGTLDLTSLAAQINQYGVLPSGIAVGKNTATNRYELLNLAATNGTELLAGFTLADINVWDSKSNVLTSGKAAFALLKQGTIKRSLLPVVAQRTAISHLTVSTGQFVYAD